MGTHSCYGKENPDRKPTVPRSTEVGHVTNHLTPGNSFITNITRGLMCHKLTWHAPRWKVDVFWNCTQFYTPIRNCTRLVYLKINCDYLQGNDKVKFNLQDIFPVQNKLDYFLFFYVVSNISWKNDLLKTLVILHLSYPTQWQEPL